MDQRIQELEQRECNMQDKLNDFEQQNKEANQKIQTLNKELTVSKQRTNLERKQISMRSNDNDGDTVTMGCGGEPLLLSTSSAFVNGNSPSFSNRSNKNAESMLRSQVSQLKQQLMSLRSENTRVKAEAQKHRLLAIQYRNRNRSHSNDPPSERTGSGRRRRGTVSALPQRSGKILQTKGT